MFPHLNLILTFNHWGLVTCPRSLLLAGVLPGSGLGGPMEGAAPWWTMLEVGEGGHGWKVCPW